MNQTGEELINKVKELSGKEQLQKKALQIKGTSQAAVTGLVIGLGVGYFKKYNLFISGLTGLVLGTGISYIILKYTIPEDKIINKQK